MKINWNPTFGDLKESYKKSFACDVLGKIVGVVVGGTIAVAVAPLTITYALITGTSKFDAFEFPMKIVKHAVAMPLYAAMHPYNTVVGLINHNKKSKTEDKPITTVSFDNIKNTQKISKKSTLQIVIVNEVNFKDIKNKGNIVNEVNFKDIKNKGNIVNEVNFKDIKNKGNIVNEVNFKDIKNKGNIENTNLNFTKI